MPSAIAIVDYGVGNVASVQNMLKKVGHNAVLVSEPDAVAAIPVKHFDGLHWTSDPVMDGRTVKDMWF